jgi:hypothetical protein
MTHLDLSQITLCAVDSANVPLTARALHLSMQHCKFGDAVLFSHAGAHGLFRTVTIDDIKSIADYQTFRLRKLPALLDTPLALIVEWDGYVVEPRAWRPSFQEFDYIGAKWPYYSDGMSVGNSGFSLQSKKLFKALADPRFVPVPGENVDTLICRTYRPTLEREFGIRFAPAPVADLFSYENHLPGRPTFGFHGCGNMWRYTTDAEMIEIVEQLNPYVFATDHFALLIVNYAFMRKFVPLEQIYARMREYIAPDRARALLRRVTAPATADTIFTLCEVLINR